MPSPLIAKGPLDARVQEGAYGFGRKNDRGTCPLLPYMFTIPFGSTGTLGHAFI